jgi:hypothetical protein
LIWIKDILGKAEEHDAAARTCHRTAEADLQALVSSGKGDVALIELRSSGPDTLRPAGGRIPAEGRKRGIILRRQQDDALSIYDDLCGP